MAHHQQVAIHRVQRAAVSSSVSPLFTEEVETDMLITSAPSRLPASLEAGAGAGAVLEEQIDQRAPAQQVALGLAGAVQQHVALGQIEQMPDLGRVQPLDRQEVFLPVGHGVVVAGWGGRRQPIGVSP